ncbi:hypothetical protein ACI3PL_24610, partial [Lacticaseibacillus paracasei]
IKNNVLTNAAVQFMSNPENAANWAKVHEVEIQKKISSGRTPEQALIESYKDQNRFVETVTDEPNKRKNSNVFIDLDGSITSDGSNG